MSMNGLLVVAVVLTAICTLIMLSVVASILIKEILAWRKQRNECRMPQESKTLQGGGADPA
jgi:hypothetical protein